MLNAEIEEYLEMGCKTSVFQQQETVMESMAENPSLKC